MGAMLGDIATVYGFNIAKYSLILASKNICHADGLFRLVPKNTELFEDSIIATLRTDCERKNMIAPRHTCKKRLGDLVYIIHGCKNIEMRFFLTEKNN